MKNYTDKDLVKIYGECKNSIQERSVNYNKFLLETYNKFFDKSLGFMHDYMADELLQEVIKEMAQRFYNDKV